MPKVCVRFAPSPTGFLHIGGLRTALFNWLWAKKNKGRFILRVEDTDKERFKKGAVENIIEALKWYGLDFDNEPIYQSQRLDIYKRYVGQLIKQGSAYYCFCSAERLAEVRKIQEINKQATKYDGLCRSLSADEIKKKMAAEEPHVVRLKVPAEASTEFDDIIYGHISVENKNIDDQVLLKSDGYPTYHLANVVDDHEQGITHVIRAEEWLPSTPKHILLYKAFSWQPPQFAHLPMVLGPDRSKLSKRHGAVAALEYKKLGYLPEAIINFITLLGWNPKTGQEIFSMRELIKEFDLSKVNKASAIFNKEKLDWMNKQYIMRNAQKLGDVFKYYYKKATGHDFLLPHDKYKKIVSVSAQRMFRLTDFPEVSKKYIEDTLEYDTNKLVPQGETKDATLESLKLSKDSIEKIDEVNFNEDKLKKILSQTIKDNTLNNKIVLWPLRFAITGEEKSEGVFEAMEIHGKKKTLQLVKDAIERLQKS